MLVMNAHKHPATHSRILVVILADLGDILLATPALRALRHRFPTAHIDLLTTPTGAKVLGGQGNREQRTENRERRTENGEQRTENREQRDEQENKRTREQENKLKPRSLCSLVPLLLCSIRLFLQSTYA